jgi:aspartyl/asparaginyl beta-hydroxylase (cupin superfamily)
MATADSPNFEKILSLLERRGAARLSHGPGRTLIDHLHGTMKILAHWRQSEDVIAAGLLHSIYSTDIYREQLVSASDRREIRHVAGESAERLAWLFGSILRNSFFDAVHSAHGNISKTFNIAGHRQPSVLRISPEDAGKLLVIYMANTAEQVRCSDGGPGTWLSAVSQWGEYARPLVRRAPPIFHSCQEHVSAKDERIGLEFYRTGIACLREQIGHNSANTRTAFASVRKRLPWLAEPRIHLAYIALGEKRWHDALRHTESGLTALHLWGTAWDKRLPFSAWESAANKMVELAQMGFVNPVAATRLIHATHASSSSWEERLTTLSASKPARKKISAAASRPSRLPERFETYLSAFALPNTRVKHTWYPGLSKRPVWPTKDFALARALSASFDSIRREFLAVQPGTGFQNEIEKIDRTGAWTIFPLYELGKRNDENCSRCPITASIVEKHGATQSISSAVYFSILGPHSHVAAHNGPTNMRLRCHLGIEVPGGCRLRVDSSIARWREGHCLVFDDSFEHEVWNRSAKRRVVLVVDLWHPDLTPEEISLIEGMNRYVSAHANDMSGYWKKNERAREQYAAASQKP